MGFAFPAILFGAHEMRRRWGRQVFANRLWLLIAANLLIQNLSLVKARVYEIWNLPTALIYTVFFGENPWR
jgi:hypothetical protein